MMIMMILYSNDDEAKHTFAHSSNIWVKWEELLNRRGWSVFKVNPFAVNEKGFMVVRASMDDPYVMCVFEPKKQQ